MSTDSSPEFDWSGPFKAVRTVTWTLALLCLAAIVFSGQNTNLQLYDSALRDLRQLQNIRITEEQLFWRVYLSEEAFQTGSWSPETAGDLDPMMPQSIGVAQQHPTLAEQLNLRSVLTSMGFVLPDAARYHDVGAIADQRWANFDPNGRLSDTLQFLGSGEPIIRFVIPDLSEGTVTLVQEMVEAQIGGTIPTDREIAPDISCFANEGCFLNVLIDDEIPGGAMLSVETEWPSRIVETRLALLAHEWPFFGTAPDFHDHLNDRTPLLPYMSLMRLYDEVSERTRLEAVSHLQSERADALSNDLNVLGVSVNARTMPIVAPLVILLTQIFLLIQCRALRDMSPPASRIREQFVAPLIHGWGGVTVRVVLCLVLPLAALWGPLFYKFATTNTEMGWSGVLVDVAGTYAIAGFMPQSLFAAVFVISVSIISPAIAGFTVAALQRTINMASADPSEKPLSEPPLANAK